VRSFIAATIALIAFGSRGAFADPVPTLSTEQAAKAHCPADAVVAGTLLYLSEFESARQYAMRAVRFIRFDVMKNSTR